MSITSTARVEV